MPAISGESLIAFLSGDFTSLVVARSIQGLGSAMLFGTSLAIIASAYAGPRLAWAVGILTVIMGVGGGFIMVPAMIYLLGMSTGVVVGTSLFNIIFVTAATTLLHSVESQSVDIVLAMLLLLGGVVGAQFGVRAAQKLPPERLRLFLALIVVGVAIRLAVGLTWRPAELFTVYGSS